MKPLAFAILCATAPILVAQERGPDTAPAAKKEEAAKGEIGHVLGKPLKPEDGEKITAVVFRPLLEAYAKEKGIKVTEEEIQSFGNRKEAVEEEKKSEDAEKRDQLLAELKSGKLSEEEKKQKEGELKMVEALLETDEPTAREEKKLDKGMREIASRSVLAWKTNRELYRQYGGRVIFQQSGPEPIDAYRDFLKEQEKKGAFKIADEEANKEFWKYFTDEKAHTYLSEAEAKKAFDNPWWQMAVKPAP